MHRRKFLKGAALGAGATALAAPAIAQQRKTMTIVSTWPRDFPGLGISAQRLAARITELSEGRLTTEYFAAGERVGAFDSFDEVASGNSQAYIAADYYWVGKHPGFAYFTSVPFGMTTVEWNAWIKFKGGQELWDEISGEFGLKALPLRRDRHPGRWLVQQGDRESRGPQGPEDAHSGTGRQRHVQAGRVHSVAAGRPDL
ncbi:twin-arginine translocation signal domain-containing protein [Jhaorihella thermophila]